MNNKCRIKSTVINFSQKNFQIDFFQFWSLDTLQRKLIFEG